MPYEDRFKENTKFHSAHYFLNQFQSKDYEDSIIQLDGPSPLEATTTTDPGVITVPVPSSSHSIAPTTKRLDIISPEPLNQQEQKHPALTLNTDLNDYVRTINNKNKNKKKLTNSHPGSNIETPMSRTSSASPCLITPTFTNSESNTSPELELLEFDEDDDDDDDDDDEEDDNEEHWDQDEIFQMHGDTFGMNPSVPGLFPQMNIGTNEEFLGSDRLPIEPLVHKRQ